MCPPDKWNCIKKIIRTEFFAGKTYFHVCPDYFEEK